MDFVIRKANQNDAHTTNELLTFLIKDEKKYDSNINDNCVVNRLYEDIIPNESNIVLVAEVNGNIVGYLFGYLVNNGDAYINKVSKLEAVYVAEEYRKNGIATELIREFKVWSLNNNVVFMEVQVLNNNFEAMKLYVNNGFKAFKSTLVSNIGNE